MANTAKATPQQKPARVTAPLADRSPRIYIAEANGSVASHVRSCGGISESSSWGIEKAVEELATCDGLIVTGGGDVHPSIYGARPHLHNYGYSHSRDLRELALLGAARDLGIPVLGICRGMQIIAVEAGGTLLQNVPDKVRHHEHSYSMMPVRTVRGSLVHRALGEFPDMLHLHHQAVKRLPAGFTVTARHGDGTVEAIESNDGRVVGVQFHPESVIGSTADHKGWRLFDLFVKSCERYRRRAKANGRPKLRPLATYGDAWPVAVQNYEDKIRSDFSKSQTAVKIGGTPSQIAAATNGTVVELGPKSKSKEVATIDKPVAWCGPCGVAFDYVSDYVDHVDFFHPGTQLADEILALYVEEESYAK